MMSKVFLRRSTAGFSLVELMIAVAIVGVLATIAAPSWGLFINNQRANSIRTQVAQVLRQAQAEALRTRSTQTVTLNPSVAPPTIAYKGVAQPLGENRVPPNSVGLQAVDASGAALDNKISFDGAGTLVRVDNTGATTPDLRLPIAIRISVPPNYGAKRCLILETLLGATRSVNKGQDPLCPS